MELQILQENLLKALTKTGRIIGSKPQLPILQNVLLSTEDGRLRVTSSNLETTVSVWVGAKVEKEGSLCVPSRLLTDFVLSLPKDTIHVSLSEGSLRMSCKGYSATIPGISEKEFPPLPKEGKAKTVSLDKDKLVQALESVLFAAASDEGRPLLTGIKIAKKDGKSVFAATDGYRLSVKNLPFDIDIDGGAVVPARALNEIVKTSLEEKEEEKVRMRKTDEGQLSFVCGDTDVTTRLIDGEYPAYEKIIPSSHTTRVVLDREQLHQAVKSAAIFARDNANIIRFALSGDQLVVSSNTPQVGENKVEMKVKIEGEGGEMAFNSRFLLDFLANFKEEEIVFEMTGSLNPGVFRPIKDESYLHIIMPVRVQS